MGVFMTRVFAGERTFLHPLLRPLERLCYKLCGVKEDVEQRWTQYAGSMLAFSIFSAVFLYALQRLQGFLPRIRQGFQHRACAGQCYGDDSGPGFQHGRQLHH